MTNHSAQINEAVKTFSNKMTAIMNSMLKSSISKAGKEFKLNNGTGRPVGRPRKGSTAGRKASSGPRSAKRDAAALAELRQKVVDFVTANPGKRIEEINKDLGTSTRELALPIRQLVSDGLLVTRGERRATSYTVKVLPKQPN